MAIPFNERPLCSIDDGREAAGAMGLTKFYELLDINGGPIESAMIGRRRYVRVSSLLRFCETSFSPRPAKPPRRGASCRLAT